MKLARNLISLFGALLLVGAIAFGIVRFVQTLQFDRIEQASENMDGWQFGGSDAGENETETATETATESETKPSSSEQFRALVDSYQPENREILQELYGQAIGEAVNPETAEGKAISDLLDCYTNRLFDRIEAGEADSAFLEREAAAFESYVGFLSDAVQDGDAFAVPTEAELFGMLDTAAGSDLCTGLLEDAVNTPELWECLQTAAGSLNSETKQALTSAFENYVQSEGVTPEQVSACRNTALLCGLELS